MKACQGVGGRTQTQVVDQKRTPGTGMSSGLSGCGGSRCPYLKVLPLEGIGAEQKRKRGKPGLYNSLVQRCWGSK